MIDLCHYLTDRNLVRLTSRDHDGILRELLRECLPPGPGPEREETIAGMLRAGAMKDQFLGDGFAITHLRRDSQDEIRVAAGLLAPPAVFRRGPPVHTVLCALIPMDRSNEYLGLLSRISRWWSDPSVVEAFRAADPGRILRKAAEFSAP